MFILYFEQNYVTNYKVIFASQLLVKSVNTVFY